MKVLGIGGGILRHPWRSWILIRTDPEGVSLNESPFCCANPPIVVATVTGNHMLAAAASEQLAVAGVSWNTAGV